MMRAFRPRTFAGLALLAAAFVVMACGGGGGSDAYGESNALVVEGNSVTVEMKDTGFQPQGIRVTPGTTVTWVNRDPVVHNVRQVESVFLSPDVMEQGDTFAFAFEKPGRYRYQCTYHHPNMNGVVIVEEE
ncbi:MAG: cupredoxin domain-containing protein [Dehalococcoidia bacterium]|nr:cupredoxin domain-containing protein [Dehalococcoidia bacterium]